LASKLDVTSLKAPAVLLVLLCAGFIGYIVVSSRQLPERVATHFDLRGEPDSWMSRSTHVGLMVATGIGFPGLLVGLCALAGVLPAKLVNIPRRDYWLAPERRVETARWLVRHSIWMGCLAVVFITGIQYLIVEANRRAPARLSTVAILIWAGCFVAGAALWCLALVLHFRRAN
jgi:ABC-type Fe3+ transport system permease subunit